MAHLNHRATSRLYEFESQSGSYPFGSEPFSAPLPTIPLSGTQCGKHLVALSGEDRAGDRPPPGGFIHSLGSAAEESLQPHAENS
jgi:hypothetical protein